MTGFYIKHNTVYNWLRLRLQFYQETSEAVNKRYK